MKSISLHPASVLVGLAFAAVTFLAIGAAQTQPESRTFGEAPAGRWTYFRLEGDNEGNPTNKFTVPEGQYLVVTQVFETVVTPSSSIGVRRWEKDKQIPMPELYGVWVGRQMTIRGEQENQVRAFGNGTRVVIQPGTVLTLSGFGHVDLWGYLEPVR